MKESLKINDFLVTEMTSLSSRIKSLSKMGKNDYATELEKFMIPIFNIYFNDNFEDLNDIKMNYPAIDLYSEKSGIGIQITTNSTSKKKQDTIDKTEKIISSGKLKINELYIFTMDTKLVRKKFKETTFFRNDNLLNLDSIYKLSDPKKEMIVSIIKNSYENIYDSKFLRYKLLVSNFFVSTRIYQEAKNMIDSNHVVILNGNAGTGKTITSYKILFDYIDQGYVQIRNIADLAKYQNSNLKYIIYLDDVIAPTDVDDANFEKIEEAFSTITFANKNLKIIFNSRTNIINTYSERQSRININETRQFFINTDKLTKVEKVLILKSHLLKSFSNTSLSELFQYSNERYKIYKIIEHDKFNPRIIETFSRENNTIENGLVVKLLDALDNPDKIYDEQYSVLSDLDKEILKYIAIEGGSIDFENLTNELKSFSSYKIRQSLSNLDESFLIQTQLSNDKISYLFFNPSIRDFINKNINNDIEMKKYFLKSANPNRLLRLLKNDAIETEHKINIIGQHENKKEILRNASSLNRSLYLEFEKELKDIFIEDAEIPYNYKYSKSIEEDAIAEIESQFDFLKCKFFSWQGTSNHFIRLLDQENTYNISEDLKKVILNDLRNNLHNYLFDNLISDENYVSQIEKINFDDLITLFDSYNYQILEDIYNYINRKYNYILIDYNVNTMGELYEYLVTLDVQNMDNTLNVLNFLSESITDELIDKERLFDELEYHFKDQDLNVTDSDLKAEIELFKSCIS